MQRLSRRAFSGLYVNKCLDNKLFEDDQRNHSTLVFKFRIKLNVDDFLY